jgi:hypothetical protein
MATEPFQIQIDDWKEIHALPDSWGIDELRLVLEAAEFDDQVADEDVEDMTLMALQDLDLQEACDLVLQQVFGSRLSAGVRQNLISELEEERPWEQFADVDKQAGIFRAVTLLHKAFPNAFGTPDAVRLRMTVTAESTEGRESLESLDASLILRLAAGGMDENAVLKRLFEDELAGKRFDAAEHILWQTRLLAPVERSVPASAVIELVSSHQWFDALEHAQAWRCSAGPDTRAHNRQADCT